MSWSKRGGVTVPERTPGSGDSYARLKMWR